MISGVYKITNLINNKIYIGCSINIYGRWTDHKRFYSLESIPSYNYPIYRAFRKYGIKNFKFEIIEEVSPSQIFEKEKYWIKYYDAKNPEKGYNCTDGGETGPSMPGSKNPNAKLTEDDVYQIRFLLLQGKMLSEVYPMYSNQISLRGFEHIWRGESWPNILPEAILYVKSKEYLSSARSFANKQGDKKAEIRQAILEDKKKGLKRLEVYEKYKNDYTLSGFNGVWYKK